MALSPLAKTYRQFRCLTFERRKMPAQSRAALLVGDQPVFQLFSQIRHRAVQQHALTVDGLEQMLLTTKVACGTDISSRIRQFTL
jgi:hypothetical protein